VLNENDGPAEAAIGFTDQFADAGVAKLDALFGAGYAKQNPQAFAAYIAACASNLGAFMTAATMVEQDDDFLDEALASFASAYPPEPPTKPRKGRR
jgi:hypothetical protein